MSWKRRLFWQPKNFSSPSGLAWAEKSAFFTNSKVSIIKSFINCPQKPPFYKSKTFHLQKNFACCPKTSTFFYKQNLSIRTNLLHGSQKSSFWEQKTFLLHKPFFIAIQSNSFPPSASHSHPAITYCLQKNTAVLLISALNPHAVTPERRTDSKPFRRRFVRKTGFGSCRRKLLQKYFRQSFESLPGSPEGRNPLGYFWFFSYKRKE